MRKTITVHPSPDSAIYWQDHPVIMTDDAVGGAARLALHAPGNLQAAWLRSVAPDRPCTLVDVGGNVGLFTRQALIAAPSIARVYIYEPDEQNFAHLMQNLKPWQERVRCFNSALADDDGEVVLFCDAYNSGNYSLLRSAMDNPYSSCVISTLDAAAESRYWLEEDEPIIYKSDTQGFDERLATLVDPAVWDRVSAAILEIWRIAKPQYDVDVYRGILAKFGRCRLLPSSSDFTVDEAIRYGFGVDGAWQDLVLSKS